MANRERTKAEAILNVRYQERLHFLHCRFYHRVRKVFNFITLAAGSAAIAAAIKSVPGGVAASAVVVTLISFFDVLGNFPEKAVRHDVWRRRAAELKAGSAEFDLVTIDRELARLTGDVDDEIEALRAVAFNDVLKSSGYEDGIRDESRMQRFLRVLA